MNLTLDLGDLANTALQPAGAIETAVAKLQEWMKQDGSPIRAIRREPAREARYLPMPDSLNTRLQSRCSRPSPSNNSIRTRLRLWNTPWRAAMW